MELDINNVINGLARKLSEREVQLSLLEEQVRVLTAKLEELGEEPPAVEEATNEL